MKTVRALATFLFIFPLYGILIFSFNTNYDSGSRFPASNIKSINCFEIIDHFLLPKFPEFIYQKMPSVGYEIEGEVPIGVGKEQLVSLIENFIMNKYPNANVKINEEKTFLVKIIEDGKAMGYSRGTEREALDLFESKKNSFKNIDLVENIDYEVQYTIENETFIWQVKNDLTIRPGKGMTEVEIATPILRNDRLKDESFEILSAMKKLGFNSLPDRAGLHIHVDWQNPQKEELALFILLMGDLEQEFHNLVSSSLKRRHFIGDGVLQSAKRDHLIQQYNLLINNLNTSEEVDELLEKFLDPVFSSNNSNAFVRYTKHGTMEFRFLNSTVDPSIINASQEFFSKIVIAIRSKNKNLIELLKENPEGGIKIKDLAEAVDYSFESNKEIFKKMALEIIESSY